MNISDDALINLVREAGKRILDVYHTDFQVEHKEDQSPLTEADRASNKVIVNGLQEMYPEIPILSEEGRHLPYETRKGWSRFWLVDPLDGTKEFVKKNGEFTVNIALIEGEYPAWGIIHVPVTGLIYVGTPDGAYVIDSENNKTRIEVCAPEEGSMTLVESRSHPSPELDQLLDAITRKYARIDRIQKGSSLKLCAIAEGTAHLYPRLGPTMEWDTAAGQAIVESAGGQVVDLRGQRFRYNKETLLNESFLAMGSMDASEML